MGGPRRPRPATRRAPGEWGVLRLYAHQAAARAAALAGQDVAVVTPPPRGKTLCYNLLVLQALLEDPWRGAVPLPTKALAHDQLSARRPSWSPRARGHSAAYDGDTLPAAGPGCATGAAGYLQPDMLHAGSSPPTPLARHVRPPALPGGGRDAPVPRGVRLPRGERPPALLERFRRSTAAAPRCLPRRRSPTPQ